MVWLISRAKTKPFYMTPRDNFGSKNALTETAMPSPSISKLLCRKV